MLQVEDVAAFRGERLVLRGVSFAVAAGDALLLAGPNGAGKSTLLRALAGFVRIEAGRVLWRGEDALGDLAAHARRIAFVGHLDAVKPSLTVAENLRFAARMGAGSAADAMEALGLAPLAEVPARMLSAGQRRRLALARLAAAPAPLWLLDEPTLGLDAASVARVGDLMARHRAQGGIVIAATHLPLPLPGASVLDLGTMNSVDAGQEPVDNGPDRRSSLVTPAKAEVYGTRNRVGSMGSRFRGNDKEGIDEERPRSGRSMAIFLAIVARELRLSLRHGADTVAALLFFLLAAALFPLAIGPAPETLGRIAPGIVWVCALLAAMLPLDRLFGADADDGSLDQLLLCGLPAFALSAAKALIHWLVTGLPLLVAAAPIAIMLHLPE